MSTCNGNAVFFCLHQEMNGLSLFFSLYGNIENIASGIASIGIIIRQKLYARQNGNTTPSENIESFERVRCRIDG